MGTSSVRQSPKAKSKIMAKLFRSRLNLKNPHFSERKRGCAETAAQPSAVQVGRRPPRERRGAALTARGGRRGTGQGVALSVSSCSPGRAATELGDLLPIRRSHSRPQLLDRKRSSRASWRTELAPSYAEERRSHMCAGPSTRRGKSGTHAAERGHRSVLWG